MDADGQSTTLASGASREAGCDHFYLIEDASRGFEKFLGRSRWPCSSIGAFEQYRSQPILKIPKPPAKRGLSDAKALRRLPKALMLGRNNRPSQILKLGNHLTMPYQTAAITLHHRVKSPRGIGPLPMTLARLHVAG